MVARMPKSNNSGIKEPMSFWDVYTLKFASEKHPIWYDIAGQGIDFVPIGKLSIVEVQLKEYNANIEPKLVVGIEGDKTNQLLIMGLKTISALSLIEPLLYIPKSFLFKSVQLHHEFMMTGNNTTIKFRILIDNCYINAPLSSVNLWRIHCIGRINQLRRRLDDCPLPDGFNILTNADGVF